MKGTLGGKKCRVGVDIGGTFTDFIFIDDDGKTITKKVLSTPDEYSRGILTGISEVLRDSKLDASAVEEVVHASTIVTNACIELTGAKVGLITTRGFRDILELGRGRMPVMYDLTWNKPPPLVPRYLRVEVNERINARGEVVRPLDTREASEVIDKLVASGVEAIAVCLINSPKNSIHEKKIGDLIKKKAPEMYVSLSTEVLPLMREYERTSEAVVNAYVMPLVTTYLKSLRKRLSESSIEAPLYIMQSSGGMMTPELAAERPIEIIECGPAGGVVGGAFLAQQQNIGNIITFDMGGTTCKASLVENGEFARSVEYEIGGGIHKASRLLKGNGYVVRVPSIDIAEIGAGGGSILRVDSYGVLHIGPRSAGAVPGPACYNHGGEEPTLTDANVVLGYLNQDYLVGGELKLAREKAFRAIEEKVAKPLGTTVEEAAYGAYHLANANMMRAIRAVSSERGRDPRKFILYAFGGAGPTHAVGVARELDMKSVLVPPAPGVCSAFGLLCADIERNYIQSFSNPWNKSILTELNKTFDRLVNDATSSSDLWGGQAGAKPKIGRFVDLRYQGQSYEITIPVPTAGKITEADLNALVEDFQKAHERDYGHRLAGYALQVASLRVTATIPTKRPVLGKQTAGSGLIARSQPSRRAYWGKKRGFIDTPVLTMDKVTSKATEGPVLVDCYDTTIVVPAGCSISKGDWGNIMINIEEREA
jgi:N-methylhydantoinase A